ncbi:MAG: transcription antitermination factor NusB [Bacteroidetes bacterium]|nr:transcription antitermination factor NusB [Bacteroidota bacterium]
MISRRNIRVKVMQTLYALSSLDHMTMNKSLQQAGMKMLNEKLERSLDLFTTLILYATRVAQYAETDAHQRANKYLPSAEDRNVNTKIAGNEAVWKVLSNETFSEKVKLAHLEQYLDQDWLRKLYYELARKDEYAQYITTERNMSEDSRIFRFIWEEVMLPNNDFIEYLSDELPGWEDDFPMLQILMDNFFKNSSRFNFLHLVSGEKLEYARNLLQTSLEKEDYCMELIRPKLVNWEAERVAAIDLVLLRMGVCELLYFPTIPTKVTINEYIDLAKTYSTPQSGHFVNGVLDNLLKDLSKSGQIRKDERGMKS